MKAIDGDRLKTILDGTEDHLKKIYRAGDDAEIYFLVLQIAFKIVRQVIDDLPELHSPIDFLDDGR